jgi:hypothetical protein
MAKRQKTNQKRRIERGDGTHKGQTGEAIDKNKLNFKCAEVHRFG